MKTTQINERRNLKAAAYFLGTLHFYLTGYKRREDENVSQDLLVSEVLNSREIYLC